MSVVHIHLHRRKSKDADYRQWWAHFKGPDAGPFETRQQAIEAGKQKWPGKKFSTGYGKEGAYFDIRWVDATNDATRAPTEKEIQAYIRLGYTKKEAIEHARMDIRGEPAKKSRDADLSRMGLDDLEDLREELENKIDKQIKAGARLPRNDPLMVKLDAVLREIRRAKRGS